MAEASKAPIGKDLQASEEWRRYQRVKGFYAMRDARYRTLVQLLGGNFYNNDLITTQTVTPEQASEITQVTDRQLVVNRLAVVVRNYKNFLSQPPEIDVPPRRQKDGTISQKDEKHADTLEKLLYATWAANKMDVELQGITHYTSGLGSAPIRVWPDLTRKVMGYTLIRPWSFYPMTKGNDFRRYRYVCVENPMFGEEIVEEYGVTVRQFNPGLLAALEPDKLYLVVEYVSETGISLLVGEMGYDESKVGDRVQDEPLLVQHGPQTIYRLANPMGFIPFINIPGNYIPHQAMGEGDVEGSVALNYYVSDMFNTQADIMAFTANPILVVIGSSMDPNSIPNRPGGAMVIPEQGAKASFLFPPNVAGTYFEQIQASMRFIEEQTGQPEPILGRVQPSVESGSAIQALMGGVAATISTKQRLYKIAFEEMNAMTLRAYEKVFGNIEIELQGSAGFFSGEYFSVSLKGSDIDGWYPNEVIYREGMQDFGSRLVNTLQMVGQSLISRRTAMRQLGVRSPLEEEAQIRKERIEDAMLQAGARGQGGPGNVQRERQGLQRGAIPGGAGPGGPAGGPSPEQLAQLLSGGQGGGGEPGQPTPPTQEAPPPTGAVPTQAVDEATVKRALRGVRFVGKVYLVSVEPEVRLVVTRESDKPKIEQALADLGVPVVVEVSAERPAEGIRLRGGK